MSVVGYGYVCEITIDESDRKQKCPYVMLAVTLLL